MKGITEDKVKEILESVFELINRKLLQTDNRVVSYSSLGQFRINKAGRNKKGRRVNRIIFICSNKKMDNLIHNE